MEIETEDGPRKGWSLKVERLKGGEVKGYTKIYGETEADLKELDPIFQKLVKVVADSK